MSFLLASRNFQSALLGHGAAPKKMLGKDLYRDPTGEHRVQDFIDGVDSRNRGNEKPKPTSESERRKQKAIDDVHHAELVAAARERAANLALAEDISNHLAEQEAKALREQFGIDGPDSDFANVDDADLEEVTDPEVIKRLVESQQRRSEQDKLRRDVDAKNKRASTPRVKKTVQPPILPDHIDNILAKREPVLTAEEIPESRLVTEIDEIDPSINPADLIEITDDEPTPVAKRNREKPPALPKGAFDRLVNNVSESGEMITDLDESDLLDVQTISTPAERAAFHNRVREAKRNIDSASDEAAQLLSDDVADNFYPNMPGAVARDISSGRVSESRSQDRVKMRGNAKERGDVGYRKEVKPEEVTELNDSDLIDVRSTVPPSEVMSPNRLKDRLNRIKRTPEAVPSVPELSTGNLLGGDVFKNWAPGEDRPVKERAPLYKRGETTPSADMADAKMAGIANRNEARYGVPDVAEVAQDFDDEALTAEDLVRELNGKEKLTWDDFEAIQDVLEREDIDFDDPRQLQMQMDLISKFGKAEQQWLQEQLLDRRTDAKVEQIRQRFENGQKPNAAEDLILIKWMERNKNREAARQAEAARKAEDAEIKRLNAELANADFEGPSTDNFDVDFSSNDTVVARQPEKPKGFLSGLIDKVMNSWAGKLIVGLSFASAVGMAVGNRESHDSSGQDGRASASDVARVNNNLEPVSVPVGDLGPRAGTNRNAEGSSSDAATSKTEAATSHSDAVKSTSEVEETPTPAKVTKTQNSGGSRGGSHDSPSADRVGHNSPGSPESASKHSPRIDMDHAPFEKSIQPKFEAGQNKYIAFEDGQNVLYKKVDGETIKFRFDGSGRPESASISIGSPDRNGNQNVNAVVNFDTNGDAYLNGQRDANFDSLASKALQDYNDLAQF